MEPEKDAEFIAAHDRHWCAVVAPADVHMDYIDRDCAHCDCRTGFPKLLKKGGTPMKIYCVKPPGIIRRIIKLFVK